MTSFRTSMICGIAMALASFVGCSKEEPVQPPPAATAPEEASAKAPPSGKGFSTVDYANSSSVMNKSAAPAAPAEPAKTP